ncbi:cytochrome P450, partial [Amylostereum chailletii]
SYLYFKHYEPQTRVPLINLLLTVPAILSAFLSLSSPAIYTAPKVFASYYASLLLFTGTYRLSPLHPLANYPGPTLARLSKWWSTHLMSTGHKHRYIQRLHERYGDIVRIGPNELSIRDASLINGVLGSGGLSKGPYWDNMTNPPHLLAQRDVPTHAQQRKPWDRAFSASALKDYESIIAKRSRHLVQRWQEIIRTESAAESVQKAVLDISEWMGFFSADFMGDMAFGGGFELMREGDTNGVWHLLDSGVQSGAITAQTSWCTPFIRMLQGKANQRQKLNEFARVNVENRMALGARRKDIFYHLSDEEGQMAARPTLGYLAANGVLAIVAGSDTTATALSVLLFYLLRHREAYKRLQDEVDAAFPNGEEPTNVSKLAQMDWLNGCLNEALRLQPPVPSGSQRRVDVGHGPKILGPYMLPEQTQVVLHTYSIHRDPRNFGNPDAFLPGRWLRTEKTNVDVHNVAAYIPFSHGPTQCAGKHLAIMEMRMVLSWLIQHFD